MATKAVRITPEQEKATDAQFAQVKSFVEAALRKSGLDKASVQRLIMRGDELKERLTPIFCELGADNEYADEKTAPNPQWSYDTATLPTTKKQIENLRTVLGVKPAIVPWQGETPSEADGLIAVPSPSDLGAAFKIADPLGDGYGPLTEKCVELLGASRPKFTNYRKGKLTKRHLRLHAAVKARWQQLEATTPAEEGKVRVFLLPVNTAQFYQGFSPRNARMDALGNVNRLPLGPAEVACILIAWPERLVRYEQVFIDCSGAEYSPGGDDDFEHVLYFGFGDDELKFGYSAAGSSSGYYGSAVASLPE